MQPEELSCKRRLKEWIGSALLCEFREVIGVTSPPFTYGTGGGEAGWKARAVRGVTSEHCTIGRSSSIILLDGPTESRLLPPSIVPPSQSLLNCTMFRCDTRPSAVSPCRLSGPDIPRISPDRAAMPARAGCRPVCPTDFPDERPCPGRHPKGTNEQTAQASALTSCFRIFNQLSFFMPFAQRP